MKNPFLRRLWPIVFSVMLLASHELSAQRLERIISTQTRLIRHEATEYQRKVAEARARAWVAAQRRKEAYEAEQRRKTAARTTTGDANKSKREKSHASKKSPSKSKKVPRYIAVDTVKDERSSPKAKKAVMLFDTYSEELVGNNVYDLENPPRAGEEVRFETFATIYVGRGT
jgi:NADH dehydrogenase/NADH:ubiquinone oxidoreductase subunit G